MGDNTHVGVDLAAPCGSKIYAFGPGKVHNIIDNRNDRHFGSLGYMVIIKHPASLTGREFYTTYFHMLEPPLVTLNQDITSQERLLGFVGHTGTEKCHTHFEIRYFKGLEGRFHPKWRNIYGPGDQRESTEFKNDWEDPEVMFREYPD